MSWPRIITVVVPKAARGWAAIGLFITVSTFAHAEVKRGEIFPGLAAPGVVKLGGGEVPVTTGKVVLVDFWASWCAPCKASFPAMARLHAEFGAKGLVVVAVSVDEKPAAAAAFWKRQAPPFATLHDAKQSLVRQVVVPAMPTSYIIGRDGRVRSIHQGFQGTATENELRREIEAALAAK